MSDYIIRAFIIIVISGGNIIACIIILLQITKENVNKNSYTSTIIIINRCYTSPNGGNTI